jgi:hypothetical protein
MTKTLNPEPRTENCLYLPAINAHARVLQRLWGDLSNGHRLAVCRRIERVNDRLDKLWAKRRAVLADLEKNRYVFRDTTRPGQPWQPRTGIPISNQINPLIPFHSENAHRTPRYL